MEQIAKNLIDFFQSRKIQVGSTYLPSQMKAVFIVHNLRSIEKEEEDSFIGCLD